MKTKLISTLLFSLLSLTAAADWDRTPLPNPFNDNYDGQWVTCQTTAGIQKYEDGDYGVSAARSRVIASCSTYRNPGDCRANVQCSVPMTDWYTCNTSAGISTYRNGGSSLEAALQGVVDDCGTYRNAGECRFKAVCKSPISQVEFKPWTTCQTSAGISTYMDADWSPQVALTNVVNSCSAHRNEGQCRAHVVCESPIGGGGYSPVPPVYTPAPGPVYPRDPRRNPRRNPRVPGMVVIDATPGVSLDDRRVRASCETYSNHIRVIGRGISSGVVNNQVTTVCRHTAGTSDRQCDENVVCNVR